MLSGEVLVLVLGEKLVKGRRERGGGTRSRFRCEVVESWPMRSDLR